MENLKFANSNRFKFKTSNKIFLLLTILFCAFIPVINKAQNCTYGVNNSYGNCSIDVEVYWYTTLANGVSGYCDMQTQTITNGNTWTPTCSCAGPIVEVVVKLVQVGTSAPSVGVGFVDSGSFYSTSDSGSISCGGNTTYNMNWTSSLCTISP